MKVLNSNGMLVDMPDPGSVPGSVQNSASVTMPTIYNQFGMGPEETTKQFGDAYKSSTAGYAPFPGSRVEMGKLQDTYENVGAANDVSGTVAALQKARGVNLLAGTNLAGGAADDYRASLAPGTAGADAGAKMVRAKTLLPFLQADYAGAADEKGKVDSAKHQALTDSFTIASKLADLEKGYTDSLATYNSQKANFGVNFANAQTGLALDASSKKSTNALDAWKTSLEAQRTAAALANAGGGSSSPAAVASAVSSSGPREHFAGSMGVDNGMTQTPTAAYANFLKRNNQTWGYSGY